MKVISLSRGCVAIIDDGDFEEVNRHSWCVAFTGGGRHNRTKAYAQTMIRKGDGKQTTLPMHRLIMKAKSARQIVDHINGLTLDNRRENLRIATSSQNSMNQWRKTIERTHDQQYKGITYKKAVEAWHPQIAKDGMQYTFGIWKTPEAAALMYDIASIQLHGEYGQTNGLIPRKEEILELERKACAGSVARARMCEARIRRWIENDKVIEGRKGHSILPRASVGVDGCGI